MNATHELIKTLFNGNQEAFVEHFVKSCLFLPKKEVEKRAIEMLTDINNNAKVNVRFGKTYLSDCFEAEPRKNALKKKSKKDIRKIADEEALFFIAGGHRVRVAIDSTGNQAVVAAIEKATGFTINSNSSDLLNYTLSHIWANTTHNPYYFSSLWNVVIVPNYLNYIMDKPERQDPINKVIQELMKAICIELYQPDSLMNNKVKVEKPSEEVLILAQKAIREGWIHFLDKKQEISKEKSTFENKTLEEINKLDNKDFVFRCLELMQEYDLIDEYLPLLTNAQECKESFGHYFPILLENIPENTIDNKRYYTSPLFKHNGKEYYVTNDWYEKAKEKANKRDNRPIFINWVDSLLNE